MQVIINNKNYSQIYCIYRPYIRFASSVMPEKKHNLIRFHCMYCVLMWTKIIFHGLLIHFRNTTSRHMAIQLMARLAAPLSVTYFRLWTGRSTTPGTMTGSLLRPKTWGIFVFPYIFARLSRK